MVFKNNNSHLIAKLERSFFQYAKNIAVEEGSRKYTYEELKTRAYMLAHVISPFSKQPVAVLGTPSFQTVVSILGTIFSGAIYIPIDSSFPPQRIKNILKDANVRTVVGDITSDFEKNFSDLDIDHFINLSKNNISSAWPFEVINVNLEETKEPAFVPPEFTPPEKKASDLLYIMYTSGSTGQPKGVMVRSGAFEHFLSWIEEEFQVNSEDRFAFTASIGFGASLRQVFSPLYSGATLVCFDPNTTKEPSELIKTLNKKRITIFNAPPIVLDRMVQVVPTLTNEEKNLSSVRTILVGGDIFPKEIAKNWYKHFNTKIVNLYGSTESIVNASSFEIPACESFEQHGFLPIGKPRPVFSFILQDEKGNPIDTHNTVGLLIIESPFLASGYHNNPQQTQKFFYKEGDKFFYNTGDRAMKLVSGDYLILGRQDRQIQMYGQRIELEEIEFILNQHPDVERAFVIDIKKKNWHKTFAFVKTQKKDLNFLRIFLKKHLPNFMIPHHFEVLDSLDSLAMAHSQKIDSAKLYKFAEEKYFNPINTNTSPQDTASIVKSIWCQHIGNIQNIDIDASFFDVGGDSVIAVDVYQDICKLFNIQLNPFIFYSSPTIKKLSEEIDAARNQLAQSKSEIAASDSSMTSKRTLTWYQIVFKTLNFFNSFSFSSYDKAIIKRGPVSPQQKYFINVKQLLGDQYNATFSANISGVVDVDLLQNNIKKIFSSQECLRTFFIGEKQFVVKECSPEFLFYDLSASDKKEQDKCALERTQALVNKKFNFSKPPLFRFALFKKSENDFTLVLYINHIIADGWSLQVFLTQLNQSYTSKKLPRASSYIDYTLKYKKHCRNQYQTNTLFWEKKVPFINESNKGFSAKREASNAKPETLGIDQKKLEQIAQKYQTTPFYILITLWTKTLAEFTNSQKINLFITYHNRSFPFSGLVNMIASVARMAPLFLDLDPSSKFEKMLHKTTCSYLEAINHIDFNVFKYFMSLSVRNRVNLCFNHLDFTKTQNSLNALPFKLNTNSFELRPSVKDYQYIYLFLSAHSYPDQTFLQAYGSCPKEYKQEIFQLFEEEFLKLSSSTQPHETLNV